MAEIGHIPPALPVPPVSPEQSPRERRPKPGPGEKDGRRDRRKPDGDQGEPPHVDEYA